MKAAFQTVEQAASIAAKLIASCRGTNENQQSALKLAARRSGVDASALRRLTQPSRAPKSISVDLWSRLIDGYSAHLHGELCRIEAELQRLHALGTPDRALSDLAAQADDLAARIRQAIER